MMRLRHLLMRVVTAVRRDDAEDDLERELRSHIELMAEDLEGRGVPRAEALRRARRAFGAIERTKDAHRDVRAFVWLEQARQDASYAFRILWRQPGFALAAVCTLALGIGASTAIFSVAYGVSLRPLPYRDPERLVRIYESNAASGQLEHEVSVAAFHEWRSSAPSIEAAAMFGKPGTRFLAAAEPVPIAVRSVSPGFFDVLGVAPLLGPGFRPETEYTRFTADDEAILSYSAWQRYFGGRADVIGQELEVVGAGDTDRYRVVGVMPRDFAFGEPVDVWRPALIVELPVNALLRRWRYDAAVVRVRPGTPPERLVSELEVISARLAREHPKTNGGWSASIKPLHAAVVGPFVGAAWLLLGGVIIVLLIACLNVGGLLISRAVSRERETAVRAALGAATGRLVRLWVVEGAVLAALGAGLGLLLAWSGVVALRAAAPPGVPRIDSIRLDLPVLIVTLASTALAVLISAIAPAIASVRRDLLTRLRSGSSGSGDAPRRQRARAVLLAAQCGGAAVLLVLAMMLTRSFTNLLAVDLGWDPSRVLSLAAVPPVPPEVRRPWALYVDWSERIVERLEATPGIGRAAITTLVPFSSQIHPATLARGRGQTQDETSRWTTLRHVVSTGYFETMGISILEGRAFDATDRATAAQLVGDARSPDAGVVIVSASTARLLWPGESALGQAIWLPDIDNVTWRRVIGVAEDVRFHGFAEPPGLHVFVPWAQYPTGNPRLVVRGNSDADLVPLVRSVLQELAPGTRVDQVAPVAALAARATAQPRFTLQVVTLFGALALVLAAVGIHGTLGYLVRARRREIGIRLALGATRGEILRRTLRTGLLPAVSGGLAGTAAAIALATVFRSLFFGVAPVDATSLLLAGGVLLAMALGAAIGPARLAARVDPARTLRTD